MFFNFEINNFVSENMNVHSIDNGSATVRSHAICFASPIANLLSIFKSMLLSYGLKWRDVKECGQIHTHFALPLCMILFNTWNLYCLSNELIAYLARAQKNQHRYNGISSRCRRRSSSNKQISSDLNFSPGHLVSWHFQRPLMIACAIRPFHNKFDWFFFRFSFEMKWKKHEKHE